MDEFRQAFQWPGGHRAALSVIVHVPGYGFSDEGTNQEDLLGLDYTQAGFEKLIKAFADLDIAATFAFTAESLVDDPEMLQVARDAGHEVAASLCSASGDSRDLIAAVNDELDERVHGIVARLPHFPSSELDRDWGDDSGKAWMIDGKSGDLPRLQGDPSAALIPTSPYLLDTTWLSPVRPTPPSSMLEAWTLALDAVREEGTYLPLVVHPHIIGRPGLLGTLVRFLDDVIAHGDVWIARVDHIAATWHTYFNEE